MPPKDKIPEDQENFVELDAGKPVDEIDIEVVDDTPEGDRDRPRRPADKEPELPDDSEISEYGKKVQKRMKDMKYEFHEERRAKEEAQRQLEAAVEYARRRDEELRRMRSVLAQGEETLVTTGKTGSQASIETAKAKLRKAQEEGDADGIANAQEALTKAVLEAQRWEMYQRQYKEAPQQQTQQLPPRPQVTQPAVPRPDPKAEGWARENPWFNKDKRMTGFVFGVHRDLVEEGVDPRSDEYYNRIDEEMRKAFPDKFGDGAGDSRRKAAAESLIVASPSRSGGKARKVQLTRSEVEIARRLGVPLEEYAKERLKASKND